MQNVLIDRDKFDNRGQGIDQELERAGNLAKRLSGSAARLRALFGL